MSSIVIRLLPAAIQFQLIGRGFFPHHPGWESGSHAPFTTRPHLLNPGMPLSATVEEESNRGLVRDGMLGGVAEADDEEEEEEEYLRDGGGYVAFVFAAESVSLSLSLGTGVFFLSPDSSPPSVVTTRMAIPPIAPRL